MKKVTITIGVLLIVIITILFGTYLFLTLTKSKIKDLEYGGPFMMLSSQNDVDLTCYVSGYNSECEFAYYDISYKGNICKLMITAYEEDETHTYERLKEENNEAKEMTYNTHIWYITNDKEFIFTKYKNNIYYMNFDDDNTCGELNMKIMNSLKFK